MKAVVNYDLIVDQMLKARFKRFKPSELFEPFATNAYQKKYVDKKGVKYFINCYEYDYTDLDREEPIYNSWTKAWTFKGQFVLMDGRTFDFKTVGWYFYPTKWGHKVCTLEDVEAFFENMWNSLGCKYCE